MDKITILTNMIILLLNDRKEDTLYKGKMLLKAVSNKKIYTGENTIIEDLENVVENLIQKPVKNKETFLDNLKLLLNNRKDIIDLIKKYANINLEENKNVYFYLIGTVDEFIKKHDMVKLLQDNLYKLKLETNLDKIENRMSDMVEQFQKLISKKKHSTNGLVEEVDLDSSDDVLLDIINRIKKKRDSKYVYQVGWECINRMLQGGLRLGEFTSIAGLQHNYKTGFTFSLFAQVPTINKPVMRFEDKKPLIALFSLEDDSENVFEFLYKYLKITFDNEVIEDMNKLDDKDVKNYIKEKMTMNGWSVKILRMDPNDITYKDIQNKIEMWNMEGYDTQVVFVDYLSQVRKDGLNMTTAGSELKDLFKKMRNYASINKISFVTPHQISTEANQLLRNGMPPIEFVKQIANKNYYDGSRRLGQEMDLELYIHIATVNKKPVLTVQRGKHRGHPNIPMDDKYAMLSFVIENKVPIPADNEHYKPCMKSNNSDFDLDI